MTAPAKTKAAKASPLTTPQVEQLLRLRYPRATHALLFGVPDDAGFNKRRTIDALAMGLWPSRGLLLEGFEIKVSRTDWLRELRNPEKAESLACYCDRFWLVVGQREIVQPGELPPTWGLLAPRGDALAVVEQATPLSPRPWDRGFLAALLKKSVEQSVDAEVIAAATKAGEEKGRTERGWHHKQLERDHAELEKKVREFEAASGVSLRYAYEGGAQIGAAVRMVLDGRHQTTEGQLRRLRDQTATVLRMLDEAIGTAATPATTADGAA